MGPITSIAIFLTIWWTVLFAVLPLGMQSHHEAGIDRGDGTDPASPVDPKLKRKFLTTTWIALVLFAVLWIVVKLGLVSLPSLPSERS